MAEMIYPDWFSEPWVELLQAARAQYGPKATGERLAHAGRTKGYSAATVIGVCEGTYQADPSGIREAVMIRLANVDVECPVLGTISLGTCGEHRHAEFRATNPLRVRLWQACKTCPNNPNREATDG